jgi:peptidylprolyl isomerase
MNNSGENSNGSEFLITLGAADMLDGYHVVFGELVEGDEILNEVEKSLSRLGTFDSDIKIEASGTK